MTSDADINIKEKIRMELYVAAYLAWVPKVKDSNKNLAEVMANKAVEHFDKKFNAKST